MAPNFALAEEICLCVALAVFGWTDAGETARILEIATEMIKSGLPIEDFKAACYGDAEGKGAGPTVLVSAVGSAESKLKMKTVGGFHLTCIFAMYGEQNRIQTKAGHKNGQDFIRMKLTH